jgi:hypothetical protein
MRAVVGGGGAVRRFFGRGFNDLYRKVTYAPIRADLRASAADRIVRALAAHAQVPTGGTFMHNPTRPMVAVLLATGALLQPARAADPVPYPTGYRDWMHVKSMVIQPGHSLYDSFGGIHHLYANDKAMQGYRSSRFPDGAVIVFDLLTAVGADNAITEGPRKVVGVMLKDSRRYAATGGWGFEGFAGDSTTERVVGDQAATACFACHEARKASDYVFSEIRP